jgi:glycosyltransferase involved in cell wall biosynthesis
MKFDTVTAVIPARDEAKSIGGLVSKLRNLYPGIGVLVVDDGSTDDTAACAVNAGAQVISHPYSKGNGAAIKTGARAATRPILVLMDGDGQHPPETVADLLDHLGDTYDMVVGSRLPGSQSSVARGFGNVLYNALASWMVGHRIPDLTSGFRAVRAERFREFLYLLPNGFSYPTTITMAFFRSGYSVAYRDFMAPRDGGASHISVVRDGLRFLLIIFRVCTLYSPLKLFMPVALLQAFLAMAHYSYTLVEFGRFTNMSAVLLTGSMITFMFGLLSEQITTLLFRKTD